LEQDFFNKPDKISIVQPTVSKALKRTQTINANHGKSSTGAHSSWPTNSS